MRAGLLFRLGLGMCTNGDKSGLTAQDDSLRRVARGRGKLKSKRKRHDLKVALINIRFHMTTFLSHWKSQAAERQSVLHAGDNTHSKRSLVSVATSIYQRETSSGFEISRSSKITADLNRKFKRTTLWNWSWLHVLPCDQHHQPDLMNEEIVRTATVERTKTREKTIKHWDWQSSMYHNNYEQEHVLKSFTRTTCCNQLALSRYTLIETHVAFATCSLMHVHAPANGRL